VSVCVYVSACVCGGDVGDVSDVRGGGAAAGGGQLHAAVAPGPGGPQHEPRPPMTRKPRPPGPPRRRNPGPARGGGGPCRSVGGRGVPSAAARTVHVHTLPPHTGWARLRRARAMCVCCAALEESFCCRCPGSYGALPLSCSSGCGYALAPRCTVALYRRVQSCSTADRPTREAAEAAAAAAVVVVEAAGPDRSARDRCAASEIRDDGLLGWGAGSPHSILVGARLLCCRGRCFAALQL
jgi:hypothetical protein